LRNQDKGFITNQSPHTNDKKHLDMQDESQIALTEPLVDDSKQDQILDEVTSSNTAKYKWPKNSGKL
jgi:hypothetical protein